MYNQDTLQNTNTNTSLWQLQYKTYNSDGMYFILNKNMQETDSVGKKKKFYIIE